MSGDWGSVMTELIPLALVVALSPLSVIPAVFVLHTPGERPRPTGLAFLALLAGGSRGADAIFLSRRPTSWAASETGGTAGRHGCASSSARRSSCSGVYRWLTRKRSAHTPRWMQSMSKLTPLRAAATAAVLTVANPKVLFICAAAGLAIGYRRAGRHRRLDRRSLVCRGGRLDRGDPDTRLRGFG